MPAGCNRKNIANVLQMPFEGIAAGVIAQHAFGEVVSNCADSKGVSNGRNAMKNVGILPLFRTRGCYDVPSRFHRRLARDPTDASVKRLGNA